MTPGFWPTQGKAPSDADFVKASQREQGFDTTPPPLDTRKAREDNPNDPHPLTAEEEYRKAPKRGVNEDPVPGDPNAEFNGPRATGKTGPVRHSQRVRGIDAEVLNEPMLASGHRWASVHELIARLEDQARTTHGAVADRTLMEEAAAFLRDTYPASV